jgi:DNA-binding CsgD family transcriptional regulator
MDEERVGTRLTVRRGLPLSPREVEVLTLVAQGLQSKEIGARIGIAPMTVKNHMTNILVKLGAWNAPHAVYLYFVPPVAQTESK